MAWHGKGHKPLYRSTITVKALRNWPFWGEPTGDGWNPLTKGHLREKCFHLVTSSWRWPMQFIDGYMRHSAPMSHYLPKLLFWQVCAFVVCRFVFLSVSLIVCLYWKRRKIIHIFVIKNLIINCISNTEHIFANNWNFKTNANISIMWNILYLHVD